MSEQHGDLEQESEKVHILVMEWVCLCRRPQITSSSKITIQVPVVAPMGWMAVFDIGAIDGVTKSTTHDHDLSLHHLPAHQPDIPDTGTSANKSFQDCDLQKLTWPLGKAPVSQDLVITRSGGEFGSGVRVSFTGN